jgi:hypothetical protein
MSFEMQDLPDIIRTIILVNFKNAKTLKKSNINNIISHMCANISCLTLDDIERTLKEMVLEGLVMVNGDTVSITGKGKMLAKEWRNFLMRSEPVMELVSGVTDGSITSLVVIISSTFFGQLTFQIAMFAAFLTMERLMNYSVSDIPDKRERGKALDLLEKLFSVFKTDIRKGSIVSALICGVTTFLAGSAPILLFLLLDTPWDVICSLSVVAIFVGIFLVRYRSSRTKMSWKVTLLETMLIIAVAVIASILLGQSL